jgi:hypothetical protein
MDDGAGRGHYFLTNASPHRPGSATRGNYNRQITRTKEASKGKEPSSKVARIEAFSFGV